MLAYGSVLITRNGRPCVALIPMTRTHGQDGSLTRNHERNFLHLDKKAALGPYVSPIDTWEDFIFINVDSAPAEVCASVSAK